jgi:dihydroorotate dehydrogenase (fumarate)
MANLETTYLGLKLKNPIVVSSSGLTNSVEKIKELEKAGAGAVVLKSLFEEQISHEVKIVILWNMSRVTMMWLRLSAR